VQIARFVTEEILRALVPILGLILMATPAVAQTIRPADARAHVGQTVTVEGIVADVHTAGRSGTTFIDMGGRYPNNALAAVIFSADASKFPNVAALSGKTVDITGAVRLYQGKPEIILNAADQLKRR
jgi:DNA/RNA endonuclease YhcR with UshA esterase domain